MKLAEVFTQLTYGELSQLNIGGAEAGAIDDTNYAKILPHVNLGLAALYKRFNLKENRLVIELIEDKVTYPLLKRFAVNGGGAEPVRYIMDTLSEPYLEDINKVERVYLDSGSELGLNDDSDIYGCFTPSYNILRIPAILVNDGVVPEELMTASLEVVYRANHPLLVYDADFNPNSIELELPYSHLEPLLLFIASRINNPIGMTNEFHAGNSYAAKYEQACILLEQKNLQVDVGSQGDRFSSKGWV
jgi:hypothetical protein